MSHDRGCFKCGDDLPPKSTGCERLDCPYGRKVSRQEAAVSGYRRVYGNQSMNEAEGYQGHVGTTPSVTHYAEDAVRLPPGAVASPPANSVQVGGSHYKSDLQHWDVVEKYGIGYCESQASKYITRWKQKNGLQDLEKAQHYVQKLLELIDSGVRTGPRGTVPFDVLDSFCRLNALDYDDGKLMEAFFTWKNLVELTAAAARLHRMVMSERAKVK